MSEPRKRKNTSETTRRQTSKPKQRPASKQSKAPNSQRSVTSPLPQSNRRPAKNVGKRNPSHVKASSRDSALWTISDSKKGKQKKSSETGFFGAVGSFFALIGRGLGLLFTGLANLIRRSPVAMAASVIIVVLLVTGGIDLAMNWGKIYPGVKIGSVDLGGYTVEEAEDLIAETYEPRLKDKYVYIFANDEVSQDMEAALESLNNHELAEQQSVQEAAESRKLWITDAALLEAKVDAAAMAQAAVEVGRSDGGIFTRLGAMFMEHEIAPWANYESQKFEELATKVDASIGSPRVNYGIVIQDGVATVTEGHDGNMVDRNVFAGELNNAFLGSQTDSGAFVAKAEYAPLQVTKDNALQVCDQVNNVLSKALVFTFDDVSFEPTRSEVGGWISTEVVSDGEQNYRLSAAFDSTHAKGMILSHLTTFDGSVMQVSFEVKNGSTVVHAQTDAQIPIVNEAIGQLNKALFSGDNTDSSVLEHTVSGVTVHLTGMDVPSTLNFEEALENGIITPIASYTTEYSSYAEARNHNIHLVASKLTDSIAGANGGTWSFNDVAGECSEETGFRAAGAIYEGELVQEYGGGICQVATTVFNAVYDAGFPVVKRQAHSLYMGSYPDGRDAAVSWPDLDLVWKNDSSSDVLLKMDCTDTSVTAILYGVSPEYQVSTETGKWQEGKKFKTKTTVDEALAPGYEYVKTVGIDGKNITIVRTVKDRNGTILHEDTFYSGYNPQDEEKVTGPKKEESTNVTNEGTTST